MDRSEISCGKRIGVHDPAVIVGEFNLVLCPDCNDSFNIMKFRLTYYLCQRVIVLEETVCGAKLYKEEAHVEVT